MSEEPKKTDATESKDDDKNKPAPAAPETVEPVQIKADPAKTHVVATWKYERPLTACRFDPLGRYVFVGTEDYTVQRFDLKDGKLTPLLGHESWCRAIGFSPDGKTTFTGGYDGRLLWWPTDADAPSPLRAITAHNGWIRALAVSPDGQRIATCGNDQLVKVWNAADGSVIHTLTGHESHVYNAAFHPDNQSLVSCDHRAIFRHWNLSDGKEVRTFSTPAIYKYDDKFRAHIGGAQSGIQR